MNDAEPGRSGCLSLERLERLVREGVPVDADAAGDDAAVESHLRDCSTCRARLAQMREVDEFIAEITQRTPRGLGDSFSSRHDQSRPPSVRDDFPGYAVEAIVDIGGQGAIYKARQLSTCRTVAIKVPLGDAVRHPARRYRFRREIELTSRLDHPGIVRVFGVCEAPDGRIGCVMEFVDGVRFDDWANARRSEGRDGSRRIVAAVAKVAEAIAYAHQRGVLHRDLKPSNVLVTETDVPRVLDFGLAKALDGGSGAMESNPFMTATGAFLGTLAYAAPEQVDGRGDAGDIRTDVYGIGLTLYQALAGRVPWDVEAAPHELCAQIQRGDAPRPTPLGGAPDAELDAIVLKAIATEMDRRYPSAALLAEDLDRWMTGRAVRARFDSRWYVLRKSAWRTRWWIAGAAAVLGLAGTLATLGLQARLRDAISSAREVESHWSLIADARATARDDFNFGEQRVWDLLLGAGEVAEEGGIEGVESLGRPFRVRTGDIEGDGADGAGRASRAVGSDWSVTVPTSPTYWALSEIYLRTPLVASLPESRSQPVAIDSTTDQLLVVNGRVIECREWRTGRIVDQLDLPLPEGVTVSGIVVRQDGACVLSGNNVVALVDLKRRSVLPFSTGFDFAVLSGPYVACFDVAADRRRLSLWYADRDAPRLLWSRDLGFQISSVAIDDGGRFLVACSLEGDVAALDLTSGTELLRRRPEEAPSYRRVGSRGRPGEILAWTNRLVAYLKWSEGGVSMTAGPELLVVDGEGVQNFLPGSLGRRCLARLDRRGLAIGHVDQPMQEWRTIPSLRGTDALPGLFSDDRHLLAFLGRGARQAILDLDSPGVTSLAQPTELEIGATPTTFCVGFTEGGDALLTATMDGVLRRYGVPSITETVNDTGASDAPPVSPSIAGAAPHAQCTTALVSAHGLTCFAVDGESTYIGTHERGGGDAQVFRVRGGAPELLLDDRRSWFCGMVVEPGRSLWALGGNGRLFRMNLETGAIEAERALMPSRAYRSIARLAPRGLVLAGSRHPELHLLDETTLEPACQSFPIDSVCEIVVSPTDPDLFVTTHDTGVIRVWRISGDVTPDQPPQITLLREMGAHASPVFCAAFHPSGRLLATGGGAAETRDVRLWDVERGRELAAFSLFELGVFSVAFSPDGRWLAAGGEPVPDRFAEGGQAFLIDLTMPERSIAGNLEYHITRWTRDHAGSSPPQSELLRRRFGMKGER